MPKATIGSRNNSFDIKIKKAIFALKRGAAPALSYHTNVTPVAMHGSLISIVEIEFKSHPTDT